MKKSNLEKLKESFAGVIQINYDHLGKKDVSIMSNYADQKRYLPLAIDDKIRQLESNLKTYPNIFFKLPGIASRENTQDKINALMDLKVRITSKGTSPNGTALNHSYKKDDVLDGETLELFKFANQVYSQRIFSPADSRDLFHRNPLSRIVRDLGFKRDKLAR